MLKAKPVVSFILLLILTACGGSGDDQHDVIVTPVQATLAETIDLYLANNLSDTQPGLSVLVRKDGVAVYRNSKGLANRQTQLPLTEQTGYRLASISKLFTAIAVMQLYELQQIQLHDGITLYLPELPSLWSEITIHHLLSHQSGIPDFANDFTGSQQDWLRGMSNNDLVDHYITHDELEFLPGSQGDYSNSGYVLLAEIVGRVSGMSFSDYITANMGCCA